MSICAIMQIVHTLFGLLKHSLANYFLHHHFEKVNICLTSPCYMGINWTHEINVVSFEEDPCLLPTPTTYGGYPRGLRLFKSTSPWTGCWEDGASPRSPSRSDVSSGHNSCHPLHVYVASPHVCSHPQEICPGPGLAMSMGATSEHSWLFMSSWKI